MRIAVTNDDGIDAPGIRHLARHLRDSGHDVVVVAPDSENTGAGASTGADLRAYDGVKVTSADFDGIEAYAVGGTPAVCALLAIRGAVGDVDLLASGINTGANLGPSVLHSGTVGATLTVRNFGVPALAVSLDAEVDAPDELWLGAASIADAVIRTMPAGEILTGNLNVPAVPLQDIKGVRTTVLDSSPGFRSTGVALVDELSDGSRVLKFTYARLDREPDPGSDVSALVAGYASLSWLQPLSTLLPEPWTETIVSELQTNLGPAPYRVPTSSVLQEGPNDN